MPSHCETPRPNAVRGSLGWAAANHRRARLRQDPGPRLENPQLLLTGKAEPAEFLVCTFTEKAAYELRAGSPWTRRRWYEGDLSTCSSERFMASATASSSSTDTDTASRGHDTLDDLTRSCSLNDHFAEIFGEPDENERYLGRWTTKWGAIENLIPYLNKTPRSSSIPQDRRPQRTPSPPRSVAPTALTSNSSVWPTPSTSHTCRRSFCNSSRNPTSVKRSPAESGTRWSTSTRTRTSSRKSSSFALPAHR